MPHSVAARQSCWGGVSGPPTREMESLYSTKHLGFELEPGGKRYRISHVYRDGPADREWLDLSVGDSLMAIEFTRRLQQRVGAELPNTLAMDAPNVPKRD